MKESSADALEPSTGEVALHATAPPVLSDETRGRAVLVTAIMTLAYLANIMNQGIVLVVSEQIRLDFELSNAQLGVVIGLSYMLFSAVGAVPLGRLADLRSRSLVVGASLSLMGLATALTSVVHSYWSMIVLRAVAGTGDAGVLPGAVSMISSHVPIARRPLALSVFNSGAAVGALLVYLCMGFVAEHFGWRTAYLWVGVLGVLVGLIIKIVLHDRENEASARPPSTSSVGAVARLLRIPAYRHVVLTFIAFGMTSSATWNWISPVMQRTYGFSVAEAGTLLGIGAGISTMLGSLFFGVLASRLRLRSVAAPAWAALGMQLSSAVCFVYGLSIDSAVPMMSFLACGYFGAGAGMIIVFSTIQEVAPAESRGLAVGFAVFLFSLLGQGLGPLLTGAATDAWTAAYGEDALRGVVRLAMAAGTLWACTHLALVARSLKASRSP